MKKLVYIWSDGSCSNNPGQGGYAAVIKHNGRGSIVYGYEEYTTNNRMELRAFIEGVSIAIGRYGGDASIVLYTDSKYIENSINLKWIDRWESIGYRNIKNSDLWKVIYSIISNHDIKVEWVKGHAVDDGNRMADMYAVMARSEAPDDSVIIEL